MPTNSPASQLTPHWSTTDNTTVRLYCGEVLDVLRQLPDCSVHCAITSPPYWGLRDYGHPDQLGLERNPSCFGWVENQLCEVCYCCRLTSVFREMRRVLRDDASFWLNIGDSYSGKQLVGVPWALALALRADGWVLRQDIILSKPSPMPESIRDRCTRSHDYLILLAKNERYYYDQEAIKEESVEAGRVVKAYAVDAKTKTACDEVHDTRTRLWIANTERVVPARRNSRSVWSLSPSGYKGAHFAVFSQSLPERCIKAGSSEKGCCPRCGAPWVRQLKRDRRPTRPGADTKINGHTPEQFGNRDPLRHCTTVETLDWAQGCGCPPAQPVPCTILDTFVGSGTTCAVAVLLGRRSVGIDISQEYIDRHATMRVRDALRQTDQERLIPIRPVKPLR